MKKTQKFHIPLSSVTAVHAALAAMAVIPAVYAADTGDEIRELTQPASQVEIGVGNVSKSSAKFGEYNGLDESGAYGIASFDLYGRGAEDSAFRWQINATDLGLDTRSLQGDVGEQGRYRIKFGYDELQRNYSDTYKTLWNGAGSTSLTLPAGYPAASTRVSSTTTAANALANWNNIQAPNATNVTTGGGPGYVIPANMKNFDVGTKRTTYDLGLGLDLASHWEFKVSARHQVKDGTKLTGVNMNRFSGPSALMPEPIDSSTDLFEAALRFADAKSDFNLGYSGSYYRNKINLWTVEYAGAASTTPIPNNLARISSMPDNEMHQLNLAGGYNFTKMTRLVLSGSYARMTQNESFLASPTTWVVPENSANAKVINTSLMAKLTSRPAHNLGLNASYKYDDRNNKTPIHDFLTTPDTIAASNTQYTNEPINRRLRQFNLDADYALSRGQGVKVGYEWQEIRRTADGDASPFRTEKTSENTWLAEYRNSLAESVTGRLSYAYSQRRAKGYEEGDPAPTSPAAPLPAADPLLPGFHQFFLADRNRDKLRGALNLDATERLSLQASLDYNRDKYNKSPYGLKESNSWVLGLDGAFAASEDVTFDAFYTYEDMQSKLESLAIARGLSTSTLEAHTACAAYPVVSGNLPADYWTDPCRNWSEANADKVHTVGVGFKSKGLMQRKLELSGNLAYSRATTEIKMTGGSYYSNSLTTLNNVVVPAESFPDVTSNMADLRLTGLYTVDKVSAVRLSYLYRRLRSEDWQYDAYTNSALGPIAIQGYIGNNLTAPNYTVQVFGIAYRYTFR